MNTNNDGASLLGSLQQLLRVSNVSRVAHDLPHTRPWYRAQRVGATRRLNPRAARLLLLLAAASVGSKNVYAADSAATIPTAGSDIKGGDIIFFRSDAPIFRKVFPASNPTDSAAATDPKKKARDAANADVQAAKADVGLKDSIAKSADELAAAAHKKAADPAATEQDKSWAKTTAATAAQAATDAKNSHAVSDGKTAYAAAVSKALAPPVTAAASNSNTDNINVLCAPMNSRFNVESVVAAATTAATTTTNSVKNEDVDKDPSKTASPATVASADGTKVSTPANGQIVRGSFTSDYKLFHFRALPFPPRPAMPATTGAATLATVTAPNTVDKGTCNNSPNNIVDYDIPYEFTSEDFQKVRSQRMGFTWGGLVVPYKFYVSDRSFQSNTSAVAYVGYEGYFPGVNLAGIVALGPGAASTSQTQAAASPQTTPTTKSTTSVTYTAATGIVATFAGVMKVGAVVGWDWQGKSAGFRYEGKTWLALSIGAGF